MNIKQLEEQEVIYLKIQEQMQSPEFFNSAETQENL